MRENDRVDNIKISVKGAIMRAHVKKMAVIAVLCLALMIQANQSFARGGGGGGGPGGGGPGPGGGGPGGPFYPPGRCFDVLPLAAAMLFMAGVTYYYCEGVFYQRRANTYVVVPAPVGAVVTTVPTGAQVIIIDGVPYYTVNNVTYMYTPYGYQVVPQPAIVQTVVQPAVVTAPNTAPSIQAAAPASAKTAVENTSQAAPATNAEDSFTVNIPNSKGTYTPVTLKRSGNGFVGPQGEYYPQFPSIEQLKVMYAK